MLSRTLSKIIFIGFAVSLLTILSNAAMQKVQTDSPIKDSKALFLIFWG
jgi:hypothetical protein